MDGSKRSAGAAAGGLPGDALVEILSRAPAKSVRRFRCVCKVWRGLIDDPLNRRRLPQTLEGFFVVDSVDGDVGRLGFINFSARSVPLDLDRRFSFLTTRLPPETEALVYGDSCNGLFLLEHSWKQQPVETLGGGDYIVCNPATKHWGTIPPCQPSAPDSYRNTFLAFDPAVSSHFHLIQFWRPAWDARSSVHAYSSETGSWSHHETDLDEYGEDLQGWHRQGRPNQARPQRAFVNGVLHLIVLDMGEPRLVAVDVQGKTEMIAMPPEAEGRCWHPTPCIGQSQGRLHYINHYFDPHDLKLERTYELYIWILQDYDTEEWVLKDTVSFLKLFGTAKAARRDFQIVAIHPDRNMVFFRQPLKWLMAYDMDRKEVSSVAYLDNEDTHMNIAPYVPYFNESPALTDKH